MVKNDVELIQWNTPDFAKAIDYGQFWQGRVVSYTKDGVTQLGHIRSFHTYPSGWAAISVDWGDGERPDPHLMSPSDLTLL